MTSSLKPSGNAARRSRPTSLEMKSFRMATSGRLESSAGALEADHSVV